MKKWTKLAIHSWFPNLVKGAELQQVIADCTIQMIHLDIP